MKAGMDNKTLRKLVASAAFIVIAGVIMSFVFSRFKKPASKPDSSNINQEATLSASSIKHESIKDGVKQWSLKADRVDYFEAGKVAEFTGAQASFFAKDGREAGLSAEKCRISAETGAIEAKGDVALTYFEHTIKTAKLNYESKQHIIQSKENVRVTGPKLNMTADEFSLDLNGSIIICSGDVKGIINDLYFK